MKNREVFTESGKPEPKEITEKRDEDARQQRVEKMPRPPELERFLENFEFRILKDIFAHKMKRVGIDSMEINVITPERIAPRPPISSPSSYDPRENILSISWDDTVSEFRKYPNLNHQMLMGSVLCHEETHAVSHNECQGLAPNAKTVSSQSGYRRFTTTKGAGENRTKSEGAFRNFDEAVTEKLGFEVFQEYVTATGAISQREIKEFSDLREKDPSITPYANDMRVLDALIARISYETGVKGSDVWHAIIRGKFEGEDFSDPELRQLFADTLGPEVLEMLENSVPSTQLLDTLKLPPDTKMEKAKKKLFAWFQPLLLKVSKRAKYNTL